MKTLEHWNKHKAPRLGAALSYYAVFCLPPLLIILITMAGFIYGEAIVKGEIMNQIQGIIGQEGATFVQDLLINSKSSANGILATIIGTVVLLMGALGIFLELRNALNELWEVKSQKQNKWNFMKEDLIAFFMMAMIAILIVISFAITTFLSLFLNYFTASSAPIHFLLSVTNITVSFGLMTVLFAFIYKILPALKLPWKEVFLGGFITALLFNLGKYLISFYLSHTNITSTYGAAGSLVIILLWVFYSAQIFFFCASMIYIYSLNFGKLKKDLQEE